MKLLVLAMLAQLPLSLGILNLFRKPRGQVLGPVWAPKVVFNKGDGEEVGGSEGAQVAAELLEKIRSVQAQFVRLDGVDYKGMADSDVFLEYVAAARKLRSVDLKRDLADEGTRKAFFINVYNALLIHAMTEAVKADKAPRDLLQRLRLYATASYDIGGHILSLNDMEHGVLRGNRKGVAPLSKRNFREGSKEEALLTVPLDPRIHFALNCGARSCPPVRFYTAEGLDAELDLATKSFFSQPGGIEVAVDGEGARVTCTKLLDWYKADFAEGGDDAAVLRWIRERLDGAGERAKQIGDALAASTMSVEYFEYDWSVNEAS